MELSSDDIAPDNKKKSPFAFLFSGGLRRIILVVCIGVLVWSSIYIVDTLRNYSLAESLYAQIGEEIIGDASGVEMMYASPPSVQTPNYDASQNLTDKDVTNLAGSGTVNKEFERVKNKLYTLKQQYPDLYGWIIVPGTGISYPIMQSNDNAYYLDHSYTGAKLKAGSIFADYHNDRDLMRNYNLVLFGHHMTNNSMFHSLDNYLSADFFRTNNTVYIYTLDGMFTYQIFSVYETNKYYGYIRTIFSSRDGFVSFAEEVAGKSIHKTDTVFGTGDRLLTLSTCNNRSDDGRLAVHAVMTDYYLSPDNY